MNSESFPENNQSAEQPVNPIGPRLRRAREDLRLTITDIARQLRLTEERIEALENDDYHNMPGITFVKGYLRAYARLINLPADEIILDFERLNLMPPEIKSFMVSSYKQPILLNNKSLRWVIYLIGIALLILAATWWSSSNSNDPANLNASDPKHPSTSAKNVPPPTGALTNNTIATASSANVAKNPAQFDSANTVPESVNGTSTSQNQTDATSATATSQSSSASPTASDSAPSVSTESSNQETATTHAGDATIEDASDEPQPRKKPAARHSRQMDEPAEDDYY